MYGFYRCPVCGEQRAQRSRTRGLERFVKYFTRYRPYRCGACNWRGWCAVHAGKDLVLRFARHQSS